MSNISVHEYDTYCDMIPENSQNEFVTIFKANNFKCGMYYNDYTVSRIVNDALSHESKAKKVGRMGDTKWDGVIRYFDKIKKEFPIGFYKMVVKTLLGYGYPVRINKDIKPVKYYDNIETLENEVKKWDLELSLYRHQLSALFSIMNINRVTIMSTTSSGKSLIAYLAFRTIISKIPNARILMVVPYSNLVVQTANKFKIYEKDNFINSRVSTSNKNLDLNSQIVISTYQAFDSIDSKVLSKYLKTVDVVVVDEVHITGFDKYLRYCINYKFKIGLTGTIDTKNPEVLFRLFKNFGEIIEISDYKTLRDVDIITPVEIIICRLNYPESILKNYRSFLSSGLYHHHHRQNGKFNPRLVFDLEMDFIAQAGHKDGLILKLLKLDEFKNSNTMIFFQTDIPYMSKIYDTVVEEFGKDNVRLVNGSTSVEKRTEAQKWMEEGTGRILIASIVFSTGCDILNLHNIICAYWHKSKNITLQLVGRGMRKHSSKDVIKVWDIVDMLPDYKKESYSISHSNDRLKYFKEEGYVIKYLDVN